MATQRKKAGFDAAPLIDRLAKWASTNPALRLVTEAPLTADELDAVPSLPTGYRFPLPTPYDPARFVLPAGYRALLRRSGGLRVEWLEDGKWVTWPVVHLYRPKPCTKAQCGERFTLCDSWSAKGTTVDDREISTTDFLSFADAGLDVEASRWCFFIGGRRGPPSIYLEDNDYECLTGKYVDTGEWLSPSLAKPTFPSFEAWFTRLVTTVTAKPFDPEKNDALVNSMISKKG